MRDREWLVRRVDNSNDGGLLLSCEGVNERKKNRVFHCGGRATARYRNVLFNLNRITAKLKGEKMQTKSGGFWNISKAKDWKLYQKKMHTI